MNMKRYTYKLTSGKQYNVQAKDIVEAMWKIIEKHGADVRLAWLQQDALQDK
jgi:hypothetical protein